MPEYLAPGVYAEETSFRAKSLEGVGTSTTAFAGLTRKGPLGVATVNGNPVVSTPELITSFGDFERIYGGLDDLAPPLGTNYLAHSVKAYFDNGGSLLYISRAFLTQTATDLGLASSQDLTNGAADATKQTKFLARYPGAAGNGTVELFEVDSPATLRGMSTAKEGTLIRLGGTKIAAGAKVTSNSGPTFSLPQDSVLRLNIGGVDQPIVTFHGESAEIVAPTPLTEPVALTDATRTVVITLDGVPQTITVPGASIAREDLVDLINRALVGGFARRTATQALAIGSDRKGKLSSVSVTANTAFGLVAASATGSSIAANDVGDLSKVTADEINSLLAAAGVPVHAFWSPIQSQFILSTTATGAAVSLAVDDATAANTVSAHNALGLAPGVTSKGADGSTNTYFLKRGSTWVDSGANALNLAGLKPGDQPGGAADFLTVNAIATDADGHGQNYEGMSLDPGNPRFIGHVMGMRQTRRADDLETMFGISVGSAITAFDLRAAFFGGGPDRVVTLSGGNDGAQPIQASYEDALSALEKLDDISIVAAPGHSAYSDFQGIQGALITHAEKRRAYRIAVLDTPPGEAVSDARAVRSRIDSSYAALYYPWVVVSNPLYRPGQDQIPRELTLPPSGFVCGIYARSDENRGVIKAPANEVVQGALRFESDINFAQQEVLNPLGVNCMRFFPGRGYRLWGARTASSDPEWMYVNIRRYFIYLEATIDSGTQWAVFEPNGEALWANVRETVTAFLYNEWVGGALLGTTAQEAFFVRCDRTTMTQADLDNGRLICLVGVAAIKPAEFVIFRIGQATADAKS